LLSNSKIETILFFNYPYKKNFNIPKKSIRIDKTDIMRKIIESDKTFFNYFSQFLHKIQLRGCQKLLEEIFEYKPDCF
jgi:hypothetical protein